MLRPGSHATGLPRVQALSRESHSSQRRSRCASASRRSMRRASSHTAVRVYSSSFETRGTRSASGALSVRCAPLASSERRAVVTRRQRERTQPHPVAPNVLDRDFTASRPDERWGHRHHVHLDRRRLVLSGGHSRSLLSRRRRLAALELPFHGSAARCARASLHAPPPRRRTPSPSLRPWLPVHERRVPPTRLLNAASPSA